MGKREVNGVTGVQQLVLDYMREFFESNDQLPPMHKISDNFGWVSVNSAAGVCAALLRHGKIERNAVGKYKFVRLAVSVEGAP